MTNKACKWEQTSEWGPCICTQLRRAARRVTSFYDRALGAAGLTVTQHALLVNVARAGSISRSALAVRLGMDRTTLTRNLGPLETAKLLVAAKSEDSRERSIRVSALGMRKLHQSYALWENAQKELTAGMGPEALRRLRSALVAAENAAAAS